MKKKTAMLLLGVSLALSLFVGCGKSKEATEAANESEATEKEGTGETPPVELKNTEEEEDCSTSSAVSGSKYSRSAVS